MPAAPRAGWLFAYEWDRMALQRLGEQRFDHAGFDLFSFPSNAALIGFDLERFARRQAAVQRGLSLGELDVRAPEFFLGPAGDVGAKQVAPSAPLAPFLPGQVVLHDQLEARWVAG